MPLTNFTTIAIHRRQSFVTNKRSENDVKYHRYLIDFESNEFIIQLRRTTPEISIRFSAPNEDSSFSG